MKNILFLLSLFFTTGLMGQEFSSLPNYPYEIVFDENYSSTGSDGDGSWGSFNGGTATKIGNELVIDNVTAGQRGGILNGFTNNPSQEYFVEMIVTDLGVGGELNFYSQWATFIRTINTTGYVSFRYTADATAGAFGNRPIIVPNDAASNNVRIDKIRISEVNDTDFLTGSDIDALNFIFNFIMVNDFEDNLNNVTFAALANPPTAPINGNLEITTTSANSAICIGCGLFQDSSRYKAVIEVEIVDSPIQIQSVANAPNVFTDTIYESNIYTINFKREGDPNDAVQDGMLIKPINGVGSTIRIKRVAIERVPFEFNEVDKKIRIGQGAETSSNSSSFGVSIGYNTKSDDTFKHSTLVGYGVRHIADGNTTFPEDGSVGIGHEASLNDGRQTVVGAKAIANAVSQTIIGMGAIGFQSHDVVIGRGGIGPTTSQLTQTDQIYFSNDGLWLGNGWANYFDTPSNGITLENTPNLKDVGSYIFGRSAMDARANPTVFNQIGGDKNLVAGLATGSGESGSLKFHVGFGNNGQNTHDSFKVGVEVRSQENIQIGETYLWLYNPWTANIQQVKNSVPAPYTQTSFVRSKGYLYLDN